MGDLPFINWSNIHRIVERCFSEIQKTADLVGETLERTRLAGKPTNWSPPPNCLCRIC